MSHDAGQSPTDWTESAKVKEKLASLVFANWVDSVWLEDKFLGVYDKTSGTGIHISSQPEDEMTPWNVTFVLQKQEAFA